MEKNILCIDLKSFFAAAECVHNNMDPYKTPLVVANALQGNGAITLAITPYLKSLGVKSRCRLYEIPNHIKYVIAKPNMKLYIKYSKKVVSVYEKFISKEDICKYSIDECFLDVTNYLKLYKKTDEELAKDILDTLYKETGLTASCGIGPNLFLAKVAMDVEAKKHKNGIAKWTREDIESSLWNIYPLSKIWGIGPSLEKKLYNLGIITVKDLATFNKDLLVNKLGSHINELWNNVNGIDYRTISSMNAPAKDKSISSSSALLKDYYDHDIKPLLLDTCEELGTKLRSINKDTSTINLRISYSKEVEGGFNKTISLNKGTSNSKVIYDICENIFDQLYNNLPIRKLEVHLSSLTDSKNEEQLNLFDYNKMDNKVDKTVDDLKNKYGSNIISKAAQKNKNG